MQQEYEVNHPLIRKEIRRRNRSLWILIGLFTCLLLSSLLLWWMYQLQQPSLIQEAPYAPPESLGEHGDLYTTIHQGKLVEQVLVQQEEYYIPLALFLSLIHI